MAKIGAVQEVRIEDLKPYERNAKLHSADQIEKIAASIKEFGFLNPCLINKAGNIIAGHGRVKAAKLLGMKKVPCLYVEGLSEEQRRAFVLAENKLTELGEWDLGTVTEEIQALTAAGFDVNLTGFDFDLNINSDGSSWFDDRERWDAGKQEGNDEYNAFVEKFEVKKTTDDCYTPDNIYDAVADWVAKEYGLDRKNFVRPFYPGGDYEAEHYDPDAVVVDNPPFSTMCAAL